LAAAAVGEVFVVAAAVEGEKKRVCLHVSLFFSSKNFNKK
jgi:hypothetical protein